jgi:hypothetical protein
MSATGRKKKDGEDTKRVDLDMYPTPTWVTLEAMPFLPPLPGLDILEPGAGTGAIVDVLRRHGAQRERLRAVELDPVRFWRLRQQHRDLGDKLIQTDYLRYAASTYDKYDLIITNPPYSVAHPYIRASLRLLKPRGTVAMLLRVNFMGGQKRATWHRENRSDIKVLSRRPSFTGKGTDATEYAWFLWGWDHVNNRPYEGHWDVILPLLVARRKAA